MVEVHKVSGAAYDGNVYLVLDERPILVDAGMMAGPTLKNIKKYIDPKKIKTIVLTHCHHDHSGAAPELKEATGAKLLLKRKGGGLRRRRPHNRLLPLRPGSSGVQGGRNCLNGAGPGHWKMEA